MARPFLTYMLHCSDGSYYVGQTDDLARRVAEHEVGATSGYTAARRPVRLVWCEEFSTREEAKAAEARIKEVEPPEEGGVTRGEAGRVARRAAVVSLSSESRSQVRRAARFSKPASPE